MRVVVSVVQPQAQGHADDGRKEGERRRGEAAPPFLVEAAASPTATTATACRHTPHSWLRACGGVVEEMSKGESWGCGVCFN